MKLKNDFVTYEIGGENVLVCAGDAFSGIAKSNKTAAFIIDCLKEDTTPEKITDEMLKRFEGAPRERVLSDVCAIIEKLRQINAIEE